MTQIGEVTDEDFNSVHTGSLFYMDAGMDNVALRKELYIGNGFSKEYDYGKGQGR